MAPLVPERRAVKGNCGVHGYEDYFRGKSESRTNCGIWSQMPQVEKPSCTFILRGVKKQAGDSITGRSSPLLSLFFDLGRRSSSNDSRLCKTRNFWTKKEKGIAKRCWKPCYFSGIKLIVYNEIIPLEWMKFHLTKSIIQCFTSLRGSQRAYISFSINNSKSMVFFVHSGREPREKAVSSSLSG